MIHIVRKRRRRVFDVELECDLCHCFSFQVAPATADRLAGVAAAVRDVAFLEGFLPVELLDVDGAPAGTGDVCRNCRTIRRSGRWRKRR